MKTNRAFASLAALCAIAGTAHGDLVSYNSLDSASGLTLNGDAAITSGTQGKFGEALSLDGTGDYAAVTAGSGITGGATRTVSIWVFQDAGSSALRTPVSLGLNSTSGTKWDLDIDNTAGGIEVGVGGGRNAGSGLTGLTGSWMLVTSTLPVASGTVGNALTYLNGNPLFPGDKSGLIALAPPALRKRIPSSNFTCNRSN